MRSPGKQRMGPYLAPFENHFNPQRQPLPLPKTMKDILFLPISRPLFGDRRLTPVRGGRNNLFPRIGFAVIALLCAVGLAAGGCLPLHHEWKDPEGRPAIEKSHDHGKPGELPSGGLLEEKKTGTIIMVPKEEPIRE